MRTIVDDDGIKYEECSYERYLNSKNRHRIVKSLESQYFVEVNKKELKKYTEKTLEDCPDCGKELIVGCCNNCKIIWKFINSTSEEEQ